MLAGYDHNVLTRNQGTWNTILSAASLSTKISMINNYWVIPLIDANPVFNYVRTPQWVKDMAKFKIQVDPITGFDRNHGLGPKAFIQRTTKELSDNATRLSQFSEANVHTMDDIEGLALPPAILPRIKGNLTHFAERYATIFEHLFGPKGHWTQVCRHVVLPVAKKLDFFDLQDTSDYLFERVNPFFFHLTAGAQEMFRHSISDENFNQQAVPSTNNMVQIMNEAVRGPGFPTMNLPACLLRPKTAPAPAPAPSNQHNSKTA